MALNSINTNSAALVALQALNRTNEQLQAAQTRVNTGMRVASAKDDGASFAIAQGLRGDIKGYESIREQLSKGKGLLAVANESAKNISETLADVRSVITKLADDSVTGAQRTQYEGDYTALIAQVTRAITGSTFRGANLLNTATGVDVIGSLTGSTLTLRASDLAASVTANLTAATSSTLAKALLTGPGGGLVTAEKNIGDAMARLGVDSKMLDKHYEYVGLLVDSTEEGLSAIVDADLAKESAKLQALQVRQQLGTQTLSIANQSPNILLSLFQQ